MALKVSLQQLLKTQSDQNASDLHISVGTPPQLRIHGELCPIKIDPLTAADTESLCYSVLTEEQRRVFEEHRELDLSFSVKGVARFRANIFRQKAAVGGVFRLIPSQIKSFEDLALPAVVGSLCTLSRGLVLVTGATGSGKSTTLAAMIDKINRELPGHILTLEDPIEFSHEHKRCIVNQREVGSDTDSITRALKSSLRQDPDVVLIGELRDFETISAALTIAETGHLVFATLHTNSAISTINRIIDVFPAHQHNQVRTQLSTSLQAVMSQQLLPRTTGGRALALEILLPNPAIRSQIREDKIHMIYQSMQMGSEKTGMQTLNQSLVALVQKRAISVDTAMNAAYDADELKGLLQRAGLGKVG
ncbi:MAG: type IV pilus twitching motility protein PilT [Betaproteobacteria bacterium]|nr:type IV pilus twitching motility protein PilT [Betaproteobacteria bacterium]